jgi:hypothetical protein
LTDLKEFSVGDVSVSVDVVDPEREPELHLDLGLADGRKMGKTEDEF